MEDEYEKMAERHTKALVESMKQTISETREKVRKPLTDEQIRLVVGGDDEAQEWNRKVVKAIERAHGIGLTGVELNHVYAANVGYPERIIKAVEKLLKEKNGG